MISALDFLFVVPNLLPFRVQGHALVYLVEWHVNRVQWPLSLNQISSLLCHHDDRRVNVTVRDDRHDRRITHIQPFQAVDLHCFRIHHGHFVIGRPHLGGT